MRLAVVGVLSSLVLVSATITGCEKSSQGPTALPAPEVAISQPTVKEVTDYIEFTGTTQAVESVEIRARVKGFLDKMNFQPGAQVKAGDVLFVIDPREFKAKADQASAALEQAQAQEKLAKWRAERSRNLRTTGSVSELQTLEEEAKHDVDKAAVDKARADLEKVALDLEFTQVKTPINGRAGTNAVDVGNLVGASDNTLLTNVVRDDQVYVYFNISERELLQYRRKYPRKSDEERKSEEEAKVYLALADETDFPHQGVADYIDPRTDPATGTVRARAVFRNETGLLMPGVFSRIRVPLEKRSALLVPDVAVGIDQRGQYVLVVIKDNVVEYRPVQTGQAVDGMRVINKGLSKDDWVIVNGIQRARPGAKVNPTKSQPPAAGASAGAQPGKP
ncbi:MAG: efflux RND transporter periplasmic adaptor subunit [Pseudomonadota bacterium]